MNYKLKTLSEEVKKTEDGMEIDNYTLGSLLQISKDNKYESYPYLYKKDNQSYIFFDKYLEAIDYMLGERSMVRAYLTEDEFDKYYDDGIDKSLSEILEWVK